MRTTLMTLLCVLLLSTVAAALAQAPPTQAPDPTVTPPAREPAARDKPGMEAERAMRDDPGMDGERPPRERVGVDGERRRPNRPGRDQDRLPRPPGRGMARPGLHGPAGGGLPEPQDLLLQAIAERDPELARRLHHLRQQSPERFHRVILEALMFRLEDVLNEVEARQPMDTDDELEPPAGPRPPERPGREPLPRFPDLHERVRGLERHHEELEVRSHELAERVRDMRAYGGPENDPAKAIEELERTIQEQFEIRGELRRAELERIEREVQELRRALERMQTGLKQREDQRSRIVERRMRQLLGEELGGW